MGGVTDDEEVKKSRKKGKKSGLKPGQALSFTGLEPRTYSGASPSPSLIPPPSPTRPRPAFCGNRVLNRQCVTLDIVKAYCAP